MTEGQPCCSLWQGWRPCSCPCRAGCPRPCWVTTNEAPPAAPTALGFPQSHSTFPFASARLGAKWKIFLLQTGREVRGHSRGAELAAYRNPVCLFSRDRGEVPSVFPGIPQGFVATQGTSAPSSSSGVTSLVLQSPCSPPQTVVCLHKSAPLCELNVRLWGQQKCANIFGKSSCSVCADLCRSLT